MRLTTRLLLLLMPTVAGIMALYTIWATIERERTLVPVIRRETEAYAIALAASLDQAIRDRPPENVQDLLDRISQVPSVYAVLVYDSTGAVTFGSGPTAAYPPLQSVTMTEALQGQAAGLERTMGNERVFSSVQPIRDDRGRVTGVVEVAQPYTVVVAARSQVRRRYILNTLTLLGAVSLLTLWLVRRLVGRPIERFVDGVEAVGRGEFGSRVDPPAGGELQTLARGFNQMAENLELARRQARADAEERLALERRVRETEKLVAVGNLAAGLAHEIAAPLNVISGRAELLLGSPQETPSRERHLRIIVAQIQRITGIVRRLLDYARRREPRPRRVDLRAVGDIAIEFLEGEFTRHGVEVEAAGTSSTVIADPDQLHEVFVNLLLNAVEAMEGQSEAKHIAVTYLPAGAHTVVVEIQDSGPGIPSDQFEKLFTPFSTTKSHGTGLGLVVARSIAEEHGGRLEAENATGRGAVFRLTLPLTGTGKGIRVRGAAGAPEGREP